MQPDAKTLRTSPPGFTRGLRLAGEHVDDDSPPDVGDGPLAEPEGSNQVGILP